MTAEANPAASSYESTVRLTLIRLGSPDPERDMDGGFWKSCQAAGISPEVCAATIYSSTHHRHNVASTTIRETADVVEVPTTVAESPTREEWEVVVRRHGSMNAIVEAAGRRPDEVLDRNVVFGDFHDDERAVAFARKMTKAGFVAMTGPRKPLVGLNEIDGGLAESPSAEEKSVYRWTEVWWQYPADASKFAAHLEKLHSTIVAAAFNRIVRTNASGADIKKVIAKHRWEGKHILDPKTVEKRDLAAEGDPSAMGGVSEARRIIATSFERYNGGVRIKRQWGSSTVTRFYVHFEGDDPSKWEKIEAYGPTPGDRKTFAIERFREKHGGAAESVEVIHEGDWLLDVVKKETDPKMDNLAFIPNVVRAMQKKPYELTVKRAHELLLAYAEGGELELRPEGGIGRLSPEEKKLVLPGPHGTVLSWVRIRNASAAEPVEVIHEDAPQRIPWIKVERDPSKQVAYAAYAERYGAIKTATQVYAVCGSDLMKEDQEVFLVLPLNLRGELKAPPYEVARGQRSKVTIEAVDVLRAATDAGAEGYVVVHNHPTGKVKPSPADLKLTDNIKKATAPYGKGLCLLDHVIVGHHCAYSIFEKRLYKCP